MRTWRLTRQGLSGARRLSRIGVSPDCHWKRERATRVACSKKPPSLVRWFQSWPRLRRPDLSGCIEVDGFLIQVHLEAEHITLPKWRRPHVSLSQAEAGHQSDTSGK